MRKLILKIHVSLDGFVEGPAKDMAWMQPDNDDQWNDLFDMLKNVDLFILGKGMWKEYRDYWKRALVQPGFSENEVKYAKFASQTPHIVFSKSMKDPGWENTKVESGSLAAVVKKLKSRSGKDIQIVGGAKFASALIDTGLVDEYRLMIEPAILGKGKRLFDHLQNMHTLSLIDSRKLTNGVVVMQYRQLISTPHSKIKPGKRRTPDTESSKKAGTADDFFQGFAKPAANALKQAGISSVEQLTGYTEKSLLAMHGIGPSSLPVLKKKLKARGLDFKTK